MEFQSTVAEMERLMALWVNKVVWVDKVVWVGCGYGRVGGGGVLGGVGGNC